MFLSKVQLGGVKNPYKIHRSLWDLFPDMPDAERPFLYRVSWPSHEGPWEVLMLSRIAPDAKASDSCAILATKEFKPKLIVGQVLRFTLCANPTKRLSAERKRVPLIHEEQQIEWLRRKLGDSANLLEAQIADGRVLHFRRKGVLGKVATITFNGLLQVTEPGGLTEAVEDGIGPAKAFGCGLLSLARV